MKEEIEKQVITTFGYMCITEDVFEYMTDEQKNWVRQLIKKIIESVSILPTETHNRAMDGALRALPGEEHVNAPIDVMSEEGLEYSQERNRAIGHNSCREQALSA